MHWLLTKCKRVTRNVLANKIYGITSGLDLGYVLGKTLATISQRVNHPPPDLVICTNSKSLYNCLMQLGTTAKKRLIIDIMAIRQLYEGREIQEIRWINGLNNPANAIIKKHPNHALEDLISTNKLRVRVKSWVHRNKQKIAKDSYGANHDKNGEKRTN